jgi:tRNA threonylcarbamoyladenosine biosynthesis protein TsaB
MILALKTADHTTSAWLFAAAATSAGDPTGTLEWESGRTLSDELLGRLTQFMAGQSLALKDLTGVIVFSGPGSFTSLRIGHTVANALADSLNIPVVGAAGDEWLNHGIESLRKAKPGRPAVPVYGAEAHITKPKS